MKENSTQFNNVETAPKKAVINSTNIVEHIYAHVLAGESPEDVHEALSSVGALQDFRRQTSKMPFASFHELVEGRTNLNRLQLPPDEKDEQIKGWSAIMLERAPRFSPRVADLYQALIYAIRGESYQPHFEEIQDKMEELKKDGDLEVLFAGATPWDLKLNRIETRLVYDYLLGLRAFDKREGKEMDDDVRKWREEEIKKMPTVPSEDTDESKPGVDALERRKEGEASPSIWKIRSAYDGYCKYFREKAFTKWDSTHNTWVDTYRYVVAEMIPLSGNTDEKKGHIDLVMTAFMPAGKRRRLPIPYTHGISKMEIAGRNFNARQNQDGDVSIIVKGEEVAEVKIFLAPHPKKKFKSDPATVRAPEMQAEFSEETNHKLEEIKNKKQGNIARARAIVSYVRNRIKYLAPKDKAESESYNIAYNTHPKGFAGAVDEIKKGDCDVVNTYFSALCAKLNIPTRHVVGQSVMEDASGNLITHFGTGHAWSEVWDEIKKEWILIDATPAGDPNLEESQEDEPKRKMHRPGSFDEQEAIRPSDEELEKLRQKLAERKKQLSYTKEERQLAEATGVDLKEARQIMHEIKEADSARLPNSNELVVKALGDLWDLLVESRKRELPIFSGPVRRSEGGENISDIIRHDIGVQAGETDPMSRERPAIEIKEEKLLSGMDVYIIGDKSGSMQSSVDGENLWKFQRRFEYMLFASIHRFNYNLKEAHLPADKDLDVRTMAISFRGQNIKEDIDLDKPLSSRFTDKDKVKMWHSLSKLGAGNGDVTAIKYLYQEIKKEKEAMMEQGIEDDRLRIVVAYSDGGYVGAEKQMRAWAEEMSKLGVVMVGIGLTEFAASVPVVMHNPPKSFGEIVSNPEELIAATAKYIVSQAIKLFPEKARQNAEELIDKILDKFGIVSKVK